MTKRSENLTTMTNSNTIPLTTENMKPDFIMFPIMETKCVHCHKDITIKDALCYALGPPFYGLIHKDCAPFYHYHLRQWPHSQNYDYYMMKGSTVRMTL